jgi:hypothetical protein
MPDRSSIFGSTVQDKRLETQVRWNRSEHPFETVFVDRHSRRKMYERAGIIYNSIHSEGRVLLRKYPSPGRSALTPISVLYLCNIAYIVPRHYTRHPRSGGEPHPQLTCLELRCDPFSFPVAFINTLDHGTEGNLPILPKLEHFRPLVIALRSRCIARDDSLAALGSFRLTLSSPAHFTIIPIITRCMCRWSAGFVCTWNEYSCRNQGYQLSAWGVINM